MIVPQQAVTFFIILVCTKIQTTLKRHFLIEFSAHNQLKFFRFHEICVFILLLFILMLNGLILYDDSSLDMLWY